MATETTEEWRETATDCLVELLSTPEGQAILAAKEQELGEVLTALLRARLIWLRLDQLFHPLHDQCQVLQDAEHERQRREQAEERRQRRAEYERKRSEARRQKRAEKQPAELRPLSIAAD